MNGNYSLHLNPFGQLVFTAADGSEHVNVDAIRAFPITSGEEYIALVAQDGHELAWIPKLEDLPEPRLTLVREKLATREFMPEIRKIKRVSGFATPCTWQVETDRGDTDLTLKSEEDIRRLAHPALLILDGRGIQFIIRAPQALDTASRKILDRFL
jgi:hypothetical protein